MICARISTVDADMKRVRESHFDRALSWIVGIGFLVLIVDWIIKAFT